MSEERIVRRKLSDLRKGKTDWERLRSMTDEEIEEAARSDPDNPPLDEEFFKHAKRIIPPTKKEIRLYIDEDVLDWFKSQDISYQKLIPSVLRDYVDDQISKDE